MKSHFSIAIFCLICQLAFGQFKYKVKHYDAEDGFALTFAQTMVQDSLGFLWIQQPGGLTRFDGYNFHVYKHDPDDPERSIGSGELVKVLTDRRGSVWVLGKYTTSSFTLNNYDRKTDRFVKYKVSVTNPEQINEGDVIRSVRFEKSGGILWIATLGGLHSFDTTTGRTIRYLNKNSNRAGKFSNNHVTDIAIRDSFLLISTRNGLWKFDIKLKEFSRPECDPNDSTFLYNSEIWEICEWPNYNFDDVWLMGNDGYYKVNSQLSISQRFILPQGLYGFGVSDYDRDREGKFWIASITHGLYCYNPSDSSFINLETRVEDPANFNEREINYARVDRDQNIWVSSKSGLRRLQKQRLNFYNRDIPKGDSSSVFSGIHASTIYSTGTKDYVIINHYKKNDKNEILIASIEDDLDSLMFTPVIHSMHGRGISSFWPGKEKLWMSVWNEGVKSINVNRSTGMLVRESTRALSHDPDNANTIASNFTVAVMEDAGRNLWVGTQDKGLSKVLNNIEYGTPGSVTRYQRIELDTNSLVSDGINFLYPEDEKSFWVATTAGVDLFSEGKFAHVFRNNNNPRTLRKTSDGTLFIGTSAGLYEGKKVSGAYKFRKITLLKSDEILAIQEDRLGRLWISTAQGVICYDREENTAIEFNKDDGMSHWRSTYSSYVQYETRKGIMVISDYDGLTLFDPRSFKINHSRTRPLLTGLTINNQPLEVQGKNDEEKKIINSHITVLKELVLDHAHNNFTLEFSAMELTSPEKNLYRHKLEGFDEDWIETDWKKRTATYTNLDAGTYTFRVKASNYHGIWSDNERVLSVIILPPPWKTWWAYTLYAIAIITVLLYWRSIENKKVQLRHRTKYLSELDNLKTRFFQNISHEFRTPITLMVSPLKELYGGKFKGDLKSTYGIMLRNGNRLLRLINQLLDLSKLEAGKMQMNTAVIDLVEFLRETAAAYESTAANKNIKYSFDSDVSRLPILGDDEKLEKVFHNLLSNAFKFTKEGGEIIIRLTVAENKQAVASVRDTGIGIPADQLLKVFDRFYQVDSSQTREYEGSGLGMALAKEFVELHKGKISVESKEGSGSEFTVMLPLHKGHSIEEGLVSRDWKMNRLSNHEDHLPGESEKEISGDEEPAAVAEPSTILIIEDNADMRKYICKTLSAYYQIIEAKNGKEGFQKATELLPDLIISDVMMPEMDGYKLCTFIKTNELTSHIPVILLTAKADRESKLMGLETQADDYLSKPFDVDELLLIVRNRIEERRKMKERFSREIKLEPKHISITSLDEKFITNVLTQLESHMGDENFSIEELSIQAGYSTMHLYRKIKSLTGQTPSQFVRTIRLKRAADLLSSKSDNISQIAYQVGFSNVSYFNKCFKDQFGMTPGDFLKTARVKN